MSRPLKKKNEPGQSSFSEPHDILNNAPIGIFTSTPEGRLLSANQSMSKVFGYESPQEMINSVTDIGQHLYVDPAGREELLRLLKEKKEVFNYECKALRRDGSVIWTSRNARQVRDKSDNVIHYQGFVTDISERIQAEAELNEARRELSTILDSVPAMIWRKNKDSKYIHANRLFCDIVGKKHKEIKGKSDFDIHPEEIAKKYLSDDKIVLSSGKSVRNISQRHKKATGQAGWSLTEKLPYQGVENLPIAASLQKVQILTYPKYAPVKRKKVSRGEL